MRQTSLLDMLDWKDGVKDASVQFDGSDYVHKRDSFRLSGQILRIYNIMKDGKWRTLDEINKITNDPQASISAQLRNLRKKRFGDHCIEKRLKTGYGDGLYEYLLFID